MGRGWPLLLTSALVAAAAAAPAAGYPRPGRTELVSVARGGGAPDSPLAGLYPSISAGGRYVAFWALASNLVPDDNNGQVDVFLRDRLARTTELVSVATDGTQADGASFMSAVSADGRRVAFQSSASNLVPGDTNAAGDIFVRDVRDGTTTRVSVASDGTQANAASNDQPSISADGRYVAFTSDASNLVPGDTNGASDVFVHDLATGATQRVSVGTGGTQGDGRSYWQAMSANGRYVAFGSDGSSFDPGKTTTLTSDVYVRDRVAGTTERVSLASDGTQGDGHSGPTGVSDDGRYVVFFSDAPNLVPEDTNGVNDVFVRDRALGRTLRASVSSDGEQANGESMQFASSGISADGRFVTFVSRASNLLAGDGAPPGVQGTPTDTRPYRVYVHDLVTGSTDLVSALQDGGFGPGEFTSISADGRYVAFTSWQAELAPGATGDTSAYVRDRGAALGVADLSLSSSGDTVILSGHATFSGAVLERRDDPAGDVADAADGLGADLRSVALVQRPEEGDLVVEWDPTRLPGGRPPALGFACSYLSRFGACPGGVARNAAIVYGLDLRVGGRAYEVRASRAGFTLYDCTAACGAAPAATLHGSWGTAGPYVSAAVPLAAIDAGTGDRLEALRAFTGVGSDATGALSRLDEAALGDAELAGARVEVGVAPASAEPADVTFDVPATIHAGTFTASVDATRLHSGDTLWARACFASACGDATGAP